MASHWWEREPLGKTGVGLGIEVWVPYGFGVVHANCSGSLSFWPILTRFEVLSSAWNGLSSRGIQSSRWWLSFLVLGRQSVALTAVCGELSWRWLAPRPLWSEASVGVCPKRVARVESLCIAYIQRGQPRESSGRICS